MAQRCATHGARVAQVVERLLDRNKKVQEAACSTMATLAEEAAQHLGPYLPAVLTRFAAAFTFYQVRAQAKG
jgi:transportin-1